MIALTRRAAVALTLLVLLALPLAACGSTAPSARQSLTLGLTYIPDIQFAPFYVADALGYYRDAGLNVTFRHGIETNEFALLAAGKEDAIFAGGDETLEARSASGLDLRDVATIFQKYPVALIVPANSPIKTAADLKGRVVGVPGHYGATYTGLLALLSSAHLAPSALTIQDVGFTQVAALLSHRVDAVMGYANNEPLQLQKQGVAVRTLNVWEAQPLVSNGLVVLQSELKSHPDAVKALVSATLKGVQYASAHPADAVRISKAYVPTITDAASQANALAVLQATIPLWQGKGKAGYNDPAVWQSMASFLTSAGMLKAGADARAAYSNDYLPA
ncbi:MAG TPA: ABC transporter substrate-binding protein [Ktedonobacterales bacterium]|nr:ABC transporter substrate-binding protein [Ktedonobacterales bacterium]